MPAFCYLPDPIPQHSVTYHSRIPNSVLVEGAVDNSTGHFNENSDRPETNNKEIIIGVDEAGRGPVLGPMVYSIAYCTKEYSDNGGLIKCGFADSKKLNDERRKELMINISDNSEIGYVSTYLTPRDISSNMLAPWNLIKNLNEQAHSTTIALIQHLLDKGLNIKEVYIDTVGPPLSYQRKLETIFPGIDCIRVEKKADDKFPIVSCASICAKVSRDQWIDQLGLNAGSGYPGDPNTKNWLKSNFDIWYGWDSNIRYSWSTARDLLQNNDAIIKMKFEDDDPNLVGKYCAENDVSMMLNGNTDQRLGVGIDYFIN